MKVRKILSLICVLATLCSLLYVPASAAIAPGNPGAIDYYKQEWQGKNWAMSNMTVDKNGNKERMSFVNESGNLELFTYNETLHDRVYAQFPYSVNEDGTLSYYDTENQLTFMDESNFDIEFRLRYEGHVFFMTQWYHAAVRLEFKDNRITVDDGNGNGDSVGIVDDGQWHDYKIEVRGEKCANSSDAPSCVKFVRVFMDGGEICNFYTNKYRASYRTYKFYMDNNYDQASWAEVEHVNVTNRASSVKITSHISGDILEAGNDITLTANAGAAAGGTKNVDFYVNDVKVGSGTNSGKIAFGGFQITPAKDASVTLKEVPAGVYAVKAVCDGVESAEVTLFVKNTLGAVLSAPKNAMSNETVNLSVATSGYPAAARVEYLVNGVCVAQSNAGGSFPVTVSNLPVGSVNVAAKVYSADGAATYSDYKTIRVTADNLSNITFNREYMIDYTVTSGGSVNIKDGYFELNINHSGDSVSYKDETGATKTYGNTLGAGAYKVVVSSGNAEVYYNNQFAFAFLMPQCYDAQSVDYSGVSDFVFGGSGVKQTLMHKDWGSETEMFEYLGEFGNFFSVEFDKKDTSAETIKVYDGFYEIYVTMDSTGIWVNRQPTVGAPTERYKAADSFGAGYYRITVAEGMAQILCNNVVLGTWRSPLYTQRPSISRSVTNPSATTFVALKGTDDIYFHNEDFEGNIEEGFTAEDYWFDETDARIESDEVEAAYKHEIVTENGNSYLKMTGSGTYFLNVMTYDPSFKWKGYFSGADGDFAIRFRDTLKYDYAEIGYNAANSQWFAKSSRKTLEDFNDVDRDDDRTEIIRSTYEEQVTNLATASGSLDSGWHNFELVFDKNSATLFCDGTAVISADGFRNSFGRIGFRISGSGALGIDDVEYSGEGRVTAGLSYVTNGRSDFYRNYKGQIIAASADSGQSWYQSEDNGETWTEINGDSSYRSSNNLMLQSGKFLRVRYAGAYDYAYLYDSTSYTGISGAANGTEYTPETSAGARVQEVGTMDGIPHSGMPSRLMQIQSGPYKGRVIYCRGGSGEVYGKTYMYWSDDYDGIDDPAGKDAVWYPATVQLSYFNTGYNIQESQMVDMPDGTLRYYVRNEMGHLAYFTSSDGGETWDRPIEMKTENLIAPMCCYSIQRKGDTNTYYSFWEYDVTTANLTYLESPRNRRALAVSYDGMQTWEYVADIEEEGLTGSCTSNACNHGMRYLDGAVYMSYYHSDNLHRMFRIDETKMKPLKRFTSLHYRSHKYISVKDFLDQECVIPKTTGNSYIYGKDVYTEVNGSGLAKASVVAMAVGAKYSENGNTATLTLGSTTVTFTNGASSYAVGSSTVNTDGICYETGYLNTKVVAEIFGKTVAETDGCYVISAAQLNERVVKQLGEIESGINAEETAYEDFLTMINDASASNDVDGIMAAMNKHFDIIGFVPDTEEVEDAMAVFARMTGVEYGSTEEVEEEFRKALEAQKKCEKSTSDILISTVTEGFDSFVRVDKNQGSVAAEAGVATLDISKAGNEAFRFGTVDYVMPKGGFAFTFDYKVVEGAAENVVKIGNGENVIEVKINPTKINVNLGTTVTEKEVQLETNKLYSFKGHLTETKTSKNLTISVSDSADMNVTLCDNAPFSARGTLRGFWLEADGSADIKVQLSNVRIYTGRAVEVVSYTAADGTASATVDFLNDGEKIIGALAADYDAFWVNEDFSTDVNFTDEVKFSRITSLNAEDYTVEVKDGAMHYHKSLDGTADLEQRILIPTISSDTPANDIVFEYDLMIPGPDVWTQTADTAFMYFDIYINHPVKALRQTMNLYKERMKVGSMSYAFKDICGTASYGGMWMSFKHHYYYENGEWKCKFFYKKQSDTEWIEGYGSMNSSTNRNNCIRFFAYPEDQVEICVDNVKVHNIGETVYSGQLIMGLYDGDGRQLGVGYSEASKETIETYEIKRYNISDVSYNQAEGVVPEAKFFNWNNIGTMVPLMEETYAK